MIAAYYSFSSLFILFVLAINAALLRRWKGGLVYRLPFFIFTFFFLLISFLLPLLQEFNGYYRYKTAYDVGSLIWVSIHSALFYFMFLLGYLCFSQDIERGGVEVIKANCRRLFIYAFLVFVIGFAFSVNNAIRVMSVGLDVYFSDRLSYRGFGLFGLLAHFVYVASILFFVVLKVSFASKRAKVESYFYCLMFVLAASYTGFYYMINGNRNSVFLMLVIIFCLNYILDYRSKGEERRQGKIWPYMVGALFFMLVFSFWGFLRSNQMQVEDVGEYTQNISRSVTVSLNGAFGNSENNLWLIEEGHSWSWGATYVAAITNFVPRSIWPDKPLGAGPVMRNIVYPGSYVIGQPGNTSYTTGLLNELVINFGFVLSLLFAPLAAFIYARITVWVSSSQDAIAYLFGFVMLVLISSHFLYAEFLGFFARTFFTLLPLMFLGFARRLRWG